MPGQPWLDLATASDLIARRALSPVELLDFMMARIERINPQVNACLTVLADAARADARAAEAEIARGHRRGPLHGLTVAVKDIIHVKGARTTGGSRSLPDHVAAADAKCVALLRAAGAIVLGKLHTHELAGGVTSENERFGRCRNPWDVDRIPGGSSGGSAAATAAGLVHAALGTDTGGSIRIPAAFCGVVGLKGTFGSVSRTGVLSRSWTMDHVGPLGRRVRDVALTFQAICGHDPEDPYSIERKVPDFASALSGDVRGLRGGVLRGEFFEAGQDPAVGNAFEEALRVLESLGMKLRPATFEMATVSHTAGTLITIVEAASALEDVLQRTPELLGADVRNQLRTAKFVSATQYLHAVRIRPVIQQALDASLREVDVLLTPTTAVLPPRSTGQTTAESLMLLAKNTRPFSMPGFPALSVPAGFSRDGLPIGLQIVGRPFDEAAILRVGDAYERATAWHEAIPAIAA